jgi:hypothetical protein
MNAIVCRSNWGYFDSLDGLDLSKGEKLFVEFPDGHRRHISVVIEETSQTGSDMGRPCEIPTRKAFAEVPVYGAKGRVPLIGLLAERVK